MSFHRHDGIRLSVLHRAWVGHSRILYVYNVRVRAIRFNALKAIPWRHNYSNTFVPSPSISFENTLWRCLSLYRNWNWLIKKIKDRLVAEQPARQSDCNGHGWSGAGGTKSSYLHRPRRVLFAWTIYIRMCHLPVCYHIQEKIVNLWRPHCTYTFHNIIQ